MTAITYPTRHNNPSSGAQVWRCEDCHCFHLLAGNTLMTFTPQEFATFAEDVTECYCIQTPAPQNWEGISSQ